MQQYSLFTHGNALRVEEPEGVLDYRHVGWGAQITLKPPRGEPEYTGSVIDDGRAAIYWDIWGPGTWFHMPLTSMPTTFGRQNPRLLGITLLYEATYCRITDIHVWDGAEIVAQSPSGFGPSGFGPWSVLSGGTTHPLATPHNVRSAIGVSFRAAACVDEYRQPGEFLDDPHFRGPLPPAYLVIHAAGGQYVVDDTPFVTAHLRDSVSITVDRIGLGRPWTEEK